MHPIRTTGRALFVLALLLLVPAVSFATPADIAPSRGAASPCVASAIPAGMAPTSPYHEPLREASLPAVDFAPCIDSIVALQLATAAALEAGDTAAAHELDAEARAALDALLTAMPGAAFRALTAGAALPPTELASATGAVLGLVFDHAAHRLPRDERHALGMDVLRLLEARPDLFPFGAERLLRTPLLSLAAEPRLRAMAQRLPPALAADLLRTLWQDAVTAAEWTSSACIRHALGLLADEAAGVRAAALLVLLADAAQRDFAIARLVADPTAAVAVLPSLGDLPTEVRLACLSRAPDTNRARGPGLATVAARAPSAIVDAYWHALADGVGPELRADLVLSLGALAAEDAAIADPVFAVAMGSDPEPRVRAAALIAASVVAPGQVPALAATALTAVSPPPVLVRAVAMAAANLEAAGHATAATHLRDGLRLRSWDAGLPPPALPPRP